MKDVEGAGARGLRLLAVAEVLEPERGCTDNPADNRFAWLGFVAFSDPLRPEVTGAIAECRRAGIRVVMITGDHPGTALAIAAQTGIMTGAEVVTGADIDRMDERRLERTTRTVSVFARVRPEQKLRLVTA
jgi:Ca2+-transporting ATPase